jgi:hypothetical protein
MNWSKLFKDMVTLNFADLNKRKVLLLKKTKRLVRKLLKGEEVNCAEIPVIINNKNRLTYLLQLIEWLESTGMKNIIILDNQSTYPPLLEYYSQSPYKIIYLNRNVGPRAIWECDETKDILRDFYIYTDPDVLPDDSCTMDTLKKMHTALQGNFSIDKIGLGLRIDDLPDHYKLHKEVVEWESQFWNQPVNDFIFKAPVDTTFALYAPYASGGGECKAYRTNYPFVARHLPWYENSSDPTAENLYYTRNAAQNQSHWTELNKNQ